MLSSVLKSSTISLLAQFGPMLRYLAHTSDGQRCRWFLVFVRTESYGVLLGLMMLLHIAGGAFAVFTESFAWWLRDLLFCRRPHFYDECL